MLTVRYRPDLTAETWRALRASAESYTANLARRSRALGNALDTPDVLLPLVKLEVTAAGAGELAEARDRYRRAVANAAERCRFLGCRNRSAYWYSALGGTPIYDACAAHLPDPADCVRDGETIRHCLAITDGLAACRQVAVAEADGHAYCPDHYVQWLASTAAA